MATVIGVPQLLVRFAKAAALGEVATKASVDTLGNDVRDAAQSRAPVDTGTLRDSIRYEDGRVYTDVPYAAFVEYGTSEMSGQPYMRPAADTVEDEHAISVAAAVMRRA